MQTFYIFLISVLFIIIAIVVSLEKKEVKMNCGDCKFAENGECAKKPKPVANKDGRCDYFIKRRQK